MPKSNRKSSSTLLLSLICLLIFLSSCRKVGQPSAGLSESVLGEATTSPNLVDGSQQIRLDQVFLLVDEPGVYQFCPGDLAGAISVDPLNLTIVHQNSPVQSWTEIVDGQVCLRFFAEHHGNRYTKQSVYQLSVASDKEQQIGSGELKPINESDLDAQRIRIQKQFEEDLIYDPMVENDYPWLWARIPMAASTSLQVDTTGLDLENAEVILSFWAKSESPVTESGNATDHRVVVTFNQGEDRVINWAGNSVYTTTLQSIQGTFQTDQKLRIDLKLDPLGGTLGDTVYLDKLVISGLVNGNVFPAMYAGGNLIVPPGQVDQAIQILEFEAENPKRLFFIQPEAAGNYLLPDDAGTRYYIFRENDIRTPELRLHSGMAFDLRAPEYMGDYLVLGQQKFEPGLQRLMNDRLQSGLVPMFINIQAIYDQFGAGYPEPEAIRKFLDYAVKNWSLPPRYVLLVGDTSHQAGDLNSGSADVWVPSSFIYTALGGWTLSDADLVDFDRDGTPDLPIGRIPVRDERGLDVVVDKILGYEAQRLKNDQRQEIGMIIESGEPSFSDLATGFAASLPETFPLLDMSNRSVNFTRDWLQNYLKQPDPSLLVFIGHGSLTQLANTNLLNSDDFTSMDQASSYGVMAMFTCLTGYFGHPKSEAIGEMLLERPESGMAAVIVPTSLTLPDRQTALVSAFSDSLSDLEVRRIGDLVLQTQRLSLEIDPTDLDIVRTWLLLGDPAMRIWP